MTEQTKSLKLSASRKNTLPNHTSDPIVSRIRNKSPSSGIFRKCFQKSDLLAKKSLPSSLSVSKTVSSNPSTTSNVNKSSTERLGFKRWNGANKVLKTKSLTRSVGTQTINQNDLKFVICMEDGVPKLVVDQDVDKDGRNTVTRTIKENIKSISDTLNQIKSSQKNTFDIRKVEYFVSTIVRSNPRK